MSNPESSQKLNSNEAGADIRLEGQTEDPSFSPEERAEEPWLSLDEQITNIGNQVEIRQHEIEKLAESVDSTKSKLNQVREGLGLRPEVENPPSVSLDETKIEKLQREQEALEKQKEELLSQQEREQLIQEEKVKILQEKLNELFEEFKRLSAPEFENLLRSGKIQGGGVFESRSMGILDSDSAQSLAEAFREGIKLLPEILKAMPELMKKFDEEITAEATERVEQKIEESKKKIEEEQDKEKKPEEQKQEAPGDMEKNPIPNEDRETEPLVV